MNILVAGGAGYIGSHMCKYLAQHGHTPIVLDNMVYGHREAVKWGPLIDGSLKNRDILDEIFARYEVEAVMHFAAFAYVGESVTDPGKYYENNVSATISLLESMRRHNILKFIFSSTCATYGEPVRIPITEDHQQKPINPYGRSKLMVEQILDDYQNAYGLNSVSLRYFNAAGADPDGEIGEDHNPETHLIPLILQTALGKRESITIFGDDYSTEDGTCVRDYIHVTDLAQAHLLALERLMNNLPGDKYNLGNGDGHSVKQVIDTAREITGEKIPSNISERRAGDPAVLIGSSEKAIKELGWKPRFADLKSILNTAWRWHKNNPDGYRA